MCFVGAKSTLDVNFVLVGQVVLGIVLGFLSCEDLGAASCGAQESFC